MLVFEWWFPECVWFMSPDVHCTWNGITRLTVSPTFLTRVWRRFLGSQILGRSVKEKAENKTEKKDVRCIYHVSFEPRCGCWSLRIRKQRVATCVKSRNTHALSLWWSRVEPVWQEHWVLPCYGLAHGTAACLQWWDFSRSMMSCQSDPQWLVSIHPLWPENTQLIEMTEPEPLVC